MDYPLSNLERVFNSRGGCLYAIPLLCSATELPNLELKIQHKQLLGFHPLDIALPTEKGTCHGYIFTSPQGTRVPRRIES